MMTVAELDFVLLLYLVDLDLLLVHDLGQLQLAVQVVASRSTSRLLVHDVRRL